MNSRTWFGLLTVVTSMWLALFFGLVKPVQAAVEVAPKNIDAAASVADPGLQSPGQLTYALAFTPSMTITKVASPTSLPEPGGVVTFTVTVTNTADKEATLEALQDSDFGDLNGKGTCTLTQTLLASTGSYRCDFTETLAGDFSGPNHTNVVTATVAYSPTSSISETATATVSFNNVPPDITVSKTPSVSSVPETGANVTFTVVVTNNSTEALTLTRLVDSDFGDLGSCATNQPLTPNGGIYTCDFTKNISGNASGMAHQNTITATAEDNDGFQDEETATAAVSFTDVAPQISASKTPNVSSVPEAVFETGAVVTFTVVVTNETTEPITLTSLFDSISGNLNGKGTCATKQPVDPSNGSPYSCRFTQTVYGNFGDPPHHNTVTAVARDDEDNATVAEAEATVSFTNAMPDISVSKTPSPPSVPETGADVTFTVVVTNNSTESLTLTTLVVSDLGDLGSCAPGQPLTPGGGSPYTCSFTRTVSGNFSGLDYQNTITATANDDDGYQDQAPATATVTFEDVLPDISVSKTPSPSTVPESGADVTFTVVVTNNSTEALTLTSLVDSDPGNLGSCAINQPLAPNGGTYTCDFTRNIEGNYGDFFHRNTITATADDDDGRQDTATDTATVFFDDVPSSILVEKTASPSSIPEPGGNIKYTVDIKNTSSVDHVTVYTVTDSLSDAADLDCSPILTSSLAPNGTMKCTFSEDVTGNFGVTHTNIITVTATDDDGLTVEDSDSATVLITNANSSIGVTVQATPPFVDEPGDYVTFTITIENKSDVDLVTINTLSDNLPDDLVSQGSCSLPKDIEPNNQYICQYTALVSGTVGDPKTIKVTASGTDDDDSDVVGINVAEVTIIDVPPSMEVSKTANPSSIPEPGGPVDFTVKISNTSTAESLEVSDIIDERYGDLDGQGTCSTPQDIAAGGQYECTFSADVTGKPGDSITSTVTVNASDDDGNSLEKQAGATVTITDLPSFIEVIKTANPSSIPEPGGPVDFTIRINNTSAVDEVTIDSAIDTVHGNLNGQGNCVFPQSIGAGNSYQCSFSANVTGVEGDLQTGTVNVTATDDDGNPLTGSDSATVTIGAETIYYVNLPVIKKVSLTELSVQNDNTGGNVIFTVLGTGVSCTVPNNATVLCGVFPPGTYSVKAESNCGTATTPKTYGPGPQITRVFCK